MDQMEKKKKLLCLLFSYLSTIAFQMNLLETNIPGSFLAAYLKSFSTFSVLHFMLFLSLAVLYSFLFKQILSQIKVTGRDILYAGATGIFFALCIVIGTSIRGAESIYPLLCSPLQILKTATACIGYALLFGTIALSLFPAFQTGRICPTQTQSPLCRHKLFRFLDAHPFGATVLILCVAFLPYIVLSYPAFLMGDSQSIIPQGFNLSDAQSQYGQAKLLVLLDENVQLNGHHPIAYTLFVHGCLELGRAVFHSYNVGIFLVAMLQFFYMAIVVASMIQCLSELHVDLRIRIAVLAYFCFAPRVKSYVFLITKDVIYAYTVLFLIIQIIRVTYLPNEHRKWVKYSIYVLSLMVPFFRNEGKYVLLVWFAFLVLKMKKNRKLFAKALLLSMFAITLLNQVVMPYFKITPGSIREMLSLPFQQTARYVHYHPEEVTDRERDAIDRILGYEYLGDRYEPELSDPVKNSFNAHASKEDLKDYFAVWFEMFKKQPLLYLDATLENYYYFFFPDTASVDSYSYTWSETCMEVTNNLASSVGLDIHYPAIFHRARLLYESVRDTLFELPIINVFNRAATYIWLLLFLAAVLLWKKDVCTLFISIIPLLASLGVSLLGPCNGTYFRYVFIFTVVLPFALIIALCNFKQT